jgi:hypothetical protein
MYVHYDVPVLVHANFPRVLARLVWVRPYPFSGPTAVRLIVGAIGGAAVPIRMT